MSDVFTVLLIVSHSHHNNITSKIHFQKRKKVGNIYSVIDLLGPLQVRPAGCRLNVRGNPMCFLVELYNLPLRRYANSNTANTMPFYPQLESVWTVLPCSAYTLLNTLSLSVLVLSALHVSRLLYTCSCFPIYLH